MGCSTVLLRQQEIEQALAIREGDGRFSIERKVFLNIPQLCGPIVEVQTEYLQFVHFTVKESVSPTFSVAKNKRLT